MYIYCSFHAVIRQALMIIVKGLVSVPPLCVCGMADVLTASMITCLQNMSPGPWWKLCERVISLSPRVYALLMLLRMKIKHHMNKCEHLVTPYELLDSLRWHTVIKRLTLAAPRAFTRCSPGDLASGWGGWFKFLIHCVVSTFRNKTTEWSVARDKKEQLTLYFAKLHTAAATNVYLQEGEEDCVVVTWANDNARLHI